MLMFIAVQEISGIKEGWPKSLYHVDNDSEMYSTIFDGRPGAVGSLAKWCGVYAHQVALAVHARVCPRPPAVLLCSGEE